MEDRELIYIHCKDNQSFRDYQEKNLDKDCIHISDEYFLRGRWPARIIVLEDAYDNVMNDPIMESINTHKHLWKTDLIKLEEKEDLTETGGGENFYAG